MVFFIISPKGIIFFFETVIYLLGSSIGPGQTQYKTILSYMTFLEILDTYVFSAALADE